MGRIWKSALLIRSRSLRHSSTTSPTILGDCAVESSVDGQVGQVRPRPYQDIPGPPGLPVIGNTWRFLPIIGQYRLGELDRAMQDLHQRYGRLARLGGLLGHPDLLFVFDPDLIEQVFRAEDEDALPCRPAMPSIHYYKRTLRGDFFGEMPGVIGIHGEMWKSFRSRVNKVMLAADAAKNFTAELDAVATDFIARLGTMRDEKNELPDDFINELYRWSLESLGVAALGTRLGCLRVRDPHQRLDQAGTERLLAAVRTFFETVAVVELRKPYSRWLRTRDWRRYVAALDVFREECMRHVEGAAVGAGRSTDGGGQRALLRQVLERTGDPRLTAVLAMDLMLVGLDTSSVSTATSLYLLARNQPAQDRVFQEVSRLLPGLDSALDTAATDKMHYLRACVREALRMFPVIIGNGRCLTKDTVIGGHLVPRGVHVIFPHLVTGNDAANGFPDPHLFLPERWLHVGRPGAVGCAAAAASGRAQHAFAALPFGFGRRMCLGRRLAEHQLLILLARIVRRYRVEYHYDDFQYEITPVYAPKNPLKFRLVERSHSVNYK
ncbi:probable cytochrome P450 49a1 [Frankliniella occidentalis]|uniref:Probable cytochrome P450 49a1 n=1 Tax=Frankliniella occidentalis TaxID=133901 RepID=A0A6J1RRS3_FRAOC|nr:probable cytochrome P450 49a1 [Frankliniella occidentalis]